MYCEKCGTPIDENAKFCPNCGNNLKETQNSETALGVDITSVPVKKKKSKCLILSIVFAVIGIIPLFNILFLPVAFILAIIGYVTDEGGINKTKIASAIAITISVIVSLLWMIPALIGSPTSPSDNNNSNDSYISGVCSHSYIVKEMTVTCLNDGYTIYQCSLCNETKKEYDGALGHDWVNNKCTRCGTTMELDPQNNNILTIEQIDWEINSAQGVEPSITFTNRTRKQIAYVYFTLKFYDRMGNPAYCSIRSEHTRRLQVTGPINAGEQDTRYWDPVIYNGAMAAVKPITIEIKFTDGTWETINCTGKYWYSGSYYGGALND